MEPVPCWVQPQYMIWRVLGDAAIENMEFSHWKHGNRGALGDFRIGVPVPALPQFENGWSTRKCIGYDLPPSISTFVSLNESVNFC